MRSGDMIADRYRLVELIGSGGMGIVWLAFDTLERRQVALKRPHEGGAEMRDQLQREAEIAAKVAHRSAVEVFGVVFDGDVPWLVMEYFPARSLAAIIAQDGPQPPLRAAGIGAQIAAALAAAHAVEVAHRDVTPANVLVADDGTAKITDYGISAWRAATVTSSGKISGTAAYVSPEVANGSGAKAKSDVYSLGATLFAAVEGAPPCGTGDPDVILSRLRDGRLSPARNAGPLTPVFDALLRTDPRARPTAAQAADQLGTVSQGREVPAWVPEVGADPTTTPLARKPFLRRRGTLVSVGVAVVVAALLVTFLSWRDGPTGGADDADGLGAPNLAIRPVLGDPRTADPCAILDEKALSRFGDVTLDRAYGGFNRCDVVLDIDGDGLEEVIDVELQLLGNEGVRPPEGATLRVTGPKMDDGACVSTLLLVDGNRVNVVVDPQSDEITADPCPIAKVAADAAAARLGDGELPRRAEPFDESSLARLDACALVDPAMLAALPDFAGESPDPGYANWTCKWSGENGALRVIFEHTSPPDDLDEVELIQFGNRQGYVAEEGYDEGTCSVNLVNSQFRDDGGDLKVELAMIVAEGDYPMEQLCSMVQQLAGPVGAAIPS